MDNIKKVKLKKFTLKMPKITDFDKGNHNWKKIDIFAFEGGIHNGAMCIDCDFGGCHNCNSEIYKDNSCPYQKALRNYYETKWNTEKFNDKAKLINKYLMSGELI